MERLRSKGDEAIAAEIEQVAVTMRRHVDRELARARSAASSADACADVADVSARVVAVVARTPDGARRAWSTDVPADLSARIDPDDLAEAVGNLLENAARHARGNVAVKGRRTGSRILVTIADDGLGIPEDRLADALARGGRLDRLGGGDGLGLAIVRDIADAWNADLDLHSGPNGFVAELSLPAAD